MPTKLNSDYTVYGIYIGIFFKPVAGLAQSLERLTAEREIMGIYSRGRTNTQGFAISEVIREVKHHVYVKRQTLICTT